jgi:hypothetical protein
VDINTLVNEIDLEISRLAQARALLAGSLPRPQSWLKYPGAVKPQASKKRVLSAEARARIAAAQKKRWAALKKSAK